jgi:hypothetical protein
MRVPYYCPYCNQRSTRRWNLDVHIKRRHGGYLLGRSSDNPIFSNDPYQNIASATVADSVGDGLQPGYIPQQAPVGISQYYPCPMYGPTNIMNEQRDASGLSRETKLGELKRLVYKYPHYHNNGPDEIVKWAIYCSSTGDNKFLDEMLEQLRSIDRLANLRF